MKKIIFLFLVLSTNAFGQNKLAIPETISGQSIDLNLQKGDTQFHNGQPTKTLGVNGDILGPTLLLKRGEFVDIRVVNKLEEPTTIHWHGMHVSASNDGGPHTVIPPGTTWNPGFTIMDKAGTFWYHPHLHEHTNKHVSLGIAGLIIVEDEEESTLNLPRTYGRDDFPMVIQTKDFDSDNQIVVPSNADDVVMVNATIDPVLEVPAQIIRLRLLNGSSQRVFNIGFTENKQFYQIATDGGLVEKPIPLSRLMLSPGERTEILLNLAGNNGEVLELVSFASEIPDGIYGAQNPGVMQFMSLSGYHPNDLNGNDFKIITLKIVSPTVNAIYEIPERLVEIDYFKEESANITRSLVFTPEAMGPNQLNGDFLINGDKFEMDNINYSIPLGNIEIWSLTNQSAIAHPFHIHDVQFQILDRNGIQPPEYEKGLKDVVLVKPFENVRFITKFTDFADDEVPYMYHCHMLTHEDSGMMGQFEVVSNSSGLDIRDLDKIIFDIYPNPFNNELIIKQSDDKTSILNIIDINGALNLQHVLQKRSNKIDTSGLHRGVYFIQLIHPDGIQRYKLIKN